jgi:hypothetical protein
LRIQSNILDGIGLSANGAIPQAGDSEPIIPGTILPATSIPALLQKDAGPPQGTTNVAASSTSFMQGASFTRAAAAAAESTRLAQLLGGGCWEFDISVFWRIAAGTNAYFLTFQYGPVTGSRVTIPIFSLTGAAIETQGNFTYHGKFTMPRDHEIRFILDWTNTGGATPILFSGFWCFQRLF